MFVQSARNTYEKNNIIRHNAEFECKVMLIESYNRFQKPNCYEDVKVVLGVSDYL
jgi:hypothetical protein